MPENFEKKTLAIPGSSFPPVALYRPLKLFGKTFKVHISTGLTLSPDTVLRAALDLSLLQLLRNYKHTPDERIKDRPEKVLKDLLRGITGINKLTSTTQAGVRRLLGQFIPADTLAAALQGIEPPQPIPWQSDWEALLQGLGDPGKDEFYLIAQKLAKLDRLAFSARQLSETDIVALLEPHIGRPHESWREYNVNLSLAVAVLVDVSLQTLAWMEWAGVAEHPVDRSKMPDSRVLLLLAPGKRPLGHWLLRIQRAAHCSSLAEFSNLMLRKGIKRNDFAPSHDLLKKWSSGQQLTPMKGALSILDSVGGVVEFERERGLFAVARFLSLLCDLVVAGTRDDPPTWTVAQDQIRRRYTELYALAAGSRAR
jgi:hypothetical protein